MFGTSLEREFQLAATHFELSRNQIARFCADAMRTSFLPEGQRDDSQGIEALRNGVVRGIARTGTVRSDVFAKLPGLRPEVLGLPVLISAAFTLSLRPRSNRRRKGLPFDCKLLPVVQAVVKLTRDLGSMGSKHHFSPAQQNYHHVLRLDCISPP